MTSRVASVATVTVTNASIPFVSIAGTTLRENGLVDGSELMALVSGITVSDHALLQKRVVVVNGCCMLIIHGCVRRRRRSAKKRASRRCALLVLWWQPGAIG